MRSVPCCLFARVCASELLNFCDFYLQMYLEAVSRKRHSIGSFPVQATSCGEIRECEFEYGGKLEKLLRRKGENAKPKHGTVCL